LTHANDEVTATSTLPIASWNPTNLKGVAYLQNTATKEII